MSQLKDFVRKYRYTIQTTWPDDTAFQKIIDIVLETPPHILEKEATLSCSTIVLIVLFHLVWNNKNIANMEKLSSLCDHADWLCVRHYFSGKFQALQGNHQEALAFFDKAKQSLNGLLQISSQELTALLVAMGSADNFNQPDQSFNIFSTVLSIDTGISWIHIGEKRGIDMLESALENQKKLYGTDRHPNVAYTIRILANALIQNNRKADAIPYIQHLREIAGDCYSEITHPEHEAIITLFSSYSC